MANVTLVVCGGIAAYKACEVMRGLQKAGCDVRVAMTQDATRFVGEATFRALSHHEVVTSLYGMHETAIPHVEAADFADLVLVVPATANVMAKMACGLADDAATATILAAHSDVLNMWRNPATQANVALLRERGIRFVMPASGELACGYVGEGKLAPVEDIAAAALALLRKADGDRGAEEKDAGEKDAALGGRSIVVTAGPTHEAID